MEINEVINIDEKTMLEFKHIQDKYAIARTAFRESALMMESARMSLMKQAETLFPDLKIFRFTINWHKKTITIDSEKD